MTTTFFAGKLAVVTGGARGIGAALVEALAAADASVVAIDLDHGDASDTDAAIVRYGCDLSSDAACEGTGARIMSEHGTPDIVFNNASLAMPGSIDDIVIDDWRRALDVNVLGYVRMMKAFAPGMVARGSGQFVNVASSMGIVPDPVGAPMLMPYVASKAADIGLSQAMALALRPHGVGVSLFLPAITDTWDGSRLGATPTAEAVAQLEAVARTGVSPGETARSLLEGIQTGRFLLTNEPGLEERLRQLVENGLDAECAKTARRDERLSIELLPISEEM